MNSVLKPSYTVLAGPNRPGKSTFYSMLVDKGFRTGVFVNPDVIASRLRLQGKISEHLIDFHAGKETLRVVADFIKNRTDFTRESTLSGQEILRSISNAKAADFETNLVYVGLEHVDLSIQRVAMRVESGGHDIPLDAIRRRYEKSIRNLVKACHIADNVIFLTIRLKTVTIPWRRLSLEGYRGSVMSDLAGYKRYSWNGCQRFEVADSLGNRFMSSNHGGIYVFLSN